MTKPINFLRGIPSDDVLKKLVPVAAKGYERAIRRYGNDVLQYGHFNGFAPLRKLVGNIHEVDPERVFVGNGGLEMVSLFLKSLPENSRIIIEEATYDRVVFDAKLHGHELIGVELTPSGVDLDQLAKLIDKFAVTAFYGIPFHQNPTGINYSVENRIAVEQICKNNGVICAWDICYEPLRYDGEKNTPVAVEDWGPVLLSSFTKTISPGTKCGYVIMPQKLAGHMMHVISNTRLNPNLPTQAFISDFIESGGYKRFLNDIRQAYRPRMDALNDALNRFFPNAYPAPLTGGFFTCLTFPKIMPEMESSFIDAARKSGIGISAARDSVAPNLREQKRQNGFFTRLTFPAFEADHIRWGISELHKVYLDFQADFSSPS